MKEWICEEVLAVTIDGKAIATMLRQEQELVRCRDCKHGEWSKNALKEDMIFCYNGDTGIEDGYLHEPDWFCAEGERKDE